jgi:hypothetical protein
MKADAITEENPPTKPEKRFVAELDENLSLGPSWFVIDLQTLFMGVPQRSWIGNELLTAVRVQFLNTYTPMLDKPIELHEYTRSLHPDWYSK